MFKTTTVILFLLSLGSYAQQKLNILELYYGSDSYTLSTESAEKLKHLFNSVGNDTIIIDPLIAYCDPNGSENYNVLLANKRLRSVEDFISSQPSVIVTKIAKGEEYPENAQRLSDHAYWRRVELHYYVKTKENTPKAKTSSIPDQFRTIQIDSIDAGNVKPIVLNIHFMPGLDVLIDNSEQEIENLYQFMRGNENVFAFIRGHVCCADDYPLSSARAYVVYTALVNRGIAPARLKFQGFSNTIPAISPEIIEEHRIKNRRVDVIFSIID